MTYLIKLKDTILMKRVLYRKSINLAIGEYRPSLPNPSDAMRRVKDARFPTGRFNILVPEAPLPFRCHLLHSPNVAYSLAYVPPKRHGY